jgi:DNA polymerase III delta prime subunit
VLWLHPTSEAAVASLMHKLPQSLLLSGEMGVGLLTVARHLAGKDFAGLLQPKNAKQEHDSKSGTISAERIRELYSQTRTKQKTRRVIIIDDAERMSHSAQAAFLKLLEEPNSSTHFILTTHAPSNLLATIKSRTQHTSIQPLTITQTAELLQHENITDSTKQAQLRFIAEGLPAEIKRLLADSSSFASKASLVNDAKILLQGNSYEKLLIIQKYKADRERTVNLIDVAFAILRFTITRAPSSGAISQLDELLRVRDDVLRNRNLALRLTRFVL